MVHETRDLTVSKQFIWFALPKASWIAASNAAAVTERA
jgi:hypothetical protein